MIGCSRLNDPKNPRENIRKELTGQVLIPVPFHMYISSTLRFGRIRLGCTFATHQWIVKKSICVCVQFTGLRIAFQPDRSLSVRRSVSPFCFREVFWRNSVHWRDLIQQQRMLFKIVRIGPASSHIILYFEKSLIE